MDVCYDLGLLVGVYYDPGLLVGVCYDPGLLVGVLAGCYCTMVLCWRLGVCALMCMPICSDNTAYMKCVVD